MLFVGVGVGIQGFIKVRRDVVIFILMQYMVILKVKCFVVILRVRYDVVILNLRIKVVIKRMRWDVIILLENFIWKQNVVDYLNIICIFKVQLCFFMDYRSICKVILLYIESFFFFWQVKKIFYFFFLYILVFVVKV